VIGAMAGVMIDVPPGSRIVGIPATPEKEQMKKQVALAKLPEMRKEFIALQKDMASLKEQITLLRTQQSGNDSSR
jgi:UDP-3-O-[3-hydroxymyristoyl] glucosamine N-acyltransferase